jgi:hypothetical protein
MKGKLIPGLDGSYYATESGDVYRYGKEVHRRKQLYYRLKPFKHKSGYMRVNLRLRGKQKQANVHSLVCAAWSGERPANMHGTRHLDGDKGNNHASNLKWGTGSDNASDRTRHGKTVCGEASHLSKLTVDDVIQVREKHALGQRVCDIAREFGMSWSAIGEIVNRNTWKGV